MPPTQYVDCLSATYPFSNFVRCMGKVLPTYGALLWGIRDSIHTVMCILHRASHTLPNRELSRRDTVWARVRIKPSLLQC